MTGAPVEMPPKIPPALLDSTSILPFSASMRYGSLFSLAIWDALLEDSGQR